MFVQVTDLRKSYGKADAIGGVSFGVAEGSLFSLLGTNGAGKTTTIKILTTLIRKTSGRATVGGFDVEREADKVRSTIGVVFQEGVLDDMFTVRENLLVRGSLYGLCGAGLKAAVERTVGITGVGEIAARRYGTLSGGQKRRADIARALIHTPRLLFLDEPTTGLDPKTRRDIWQMIRGLQKTCGTTVFLTTHYMEEAAVSDDVVILNKGVIKAEGSPAALKEKYCSDLLKLTLVDGGYVEFKLRNTVEALPIIDSYKKRVRNVEIINGTLEDAFLNLTDSSERMIAN